MITPAFGLTATERVLPRLALDFTTAVLDPRVSFSRALNTATRINSSGYIEVVNADTARFDFNPVSLACRGLLIEETRTNLRGDSNLFNNWSAKSNVTVSDGTQLSPDNSTNASSIFANSGFTNAHVRLGVGGLTSGTVYTISVYVRANGSTATRFWNLNFTGTGVYNDVRFNPVTGAALSGNTGFTSTPAANGYRRYVFTFTADASNGFQLYFYPTNGVDNAQGVDAYGFQLEVGAFATSLIPTSGGTATRNADVATMTGTNFSDWFNASEGAVYHEVTPIALTGQSAYSINNGTNNESIYSYDTSARYYYRIRTGAATQATISSPPGTAVVGTTTKCVTAYESANFGISANGAATSTAASGNLPSGVTQLQIAPANNLYFRKLMYWPQRLTNAEVQAFCK